MKIKEELFKQALKARENSYSPYSKFKVGACILADNDKLYPSCNVENVSYPCGSCAEAGAISAMISDGAKKIREILIIADSENIITPCGNCLQKISEFSDDKTLVHLASLKKIEKTLLLKELLPFAFVEERLKNDK